MAKFLTYSTVQNFDTNHFLDFSQFMNLKLIINSILDRNKIHLYVFSVP